VTWAPRTAELFGTEPGEAGTYEDFLARVHPEDRDAVVATLEQARADGEQYHHELRIVRPGGEVRWISCHGRFQYDSAGQPVHLAGMVQDITGRKTTDDAIRQAKEAAEHRAFRLKLLSDTSAELLSPETPQNLMESIFQRISSHLGLEVYLHYRLDEREEGNRLALVCCSGVPEGSLPEHLELGEAVCGTVAMESKPIAIEEAQSTTGEMTELLRILGITAYVCHPLIAGGRLLGTLSFGTRQRGSFDPGELGLMRTLCDQVASAVERDRLMSELRQRSREAQEAREVAEAANRAKDEFLATLSHELRTPLTPVLLTSRALESDPRLPVELRREVERVRRNVELEARLIDDLLDLTRIARGKIPLTKEVLDLHPLLREVAETCTAGARRTPRLELHLTAPVSRVCGDAARLQQVFWNLVNNAVKFTPADGTIAIWTRAAAGGGVEVEVRDTGVGIDPAVLPRIFNAFEQGEARVTRQFGGLGLGLAISHSLVDLHHGSIIADSAGIGLGASFKVVLPTVEAAVPAPEPEERQDRGRTLHLLLVEDHADTAEAMAELLEARGYRVTVAFSRAAALEAARAAAGDGVPPLNVVVSDLGLPDGSGLDLMRELSRLHGLPGIAVSGYGTEGDLERSRDAGFTEHLTKPINLDDLEAILQRLGAGMVRSAEPA
jgi:PAS domain S-box-containing protein